MTIEGLDTGEQLAIATSVDQDLVAAVASIVQQGERTVGQFVVANATNLVFAVGMQGARLASVQGMYFVRSLHRNEK